MGEVCLCYTNISLWNIHQPISVCISLVRVPSASWLAKPTKTIFPERGIVIFVTSLEGQLGEPPQNTWRTNLQGSDRRYIPWTEADK